MSRIKPNAQMVLMYALGLVLTGILTILSCKPTQDVHVVSLQSVNWLQGRWTSSLEGQYENFILIAKVIMIVYKLYTYFKRNHGMYYDLILKILKQLKKH